MLPSAYLLDRDVPFFYVTVFAQPRRIASNHLDSLAGGEAMDTPIRGTFSGCCASAEPQQQATPLQPGLMTPQLSSLRTSFRAYVSRG